MSIKISVVEDDSKFRPYLKALIDGAPGLQCVGLHSSGESALQGIPLEKPDVVLMDIELPGLSGLECTRKLKERMSRLSILALTLHDDPQTLFDLLEAGAVGYLVKSATASTRIVEAITEAHAGGSPMSASVARLVVQVFHLRGRVRKSLAQLTAREDEILQLLVKGLQNKEIAARLHVSERTVGTHVRNIYEKLHVHSRAAATAKYLRG